MSHVTRKLSGFGFPRARRPGVGAVLLWALLAGPADAASPFAAGVVQYEPGANVKPAYIDPSVSLGEPSRLTPDPSWPSVVSMLSPAYLPSQVVQIGRGGSLTLRFDQPITDSPGHLYGVDFIVFGNSLFKAADFNGTLENPAVLFDGDAGRVEVSADGLNFYEIKGTAADQLFPTQGFLDAGPFDAGGSVPTNFLKPVKPSLSLSDFGGLSFAQALALYDGSGGGTPIDLSAAVDALGQPAGLASASYVRITNFGSEPLEIDAMAVVPEPTGALLAVAAIPMILRRKRS